MLLPYYGIGMALSCTGVGDTVVSADICTGPDPGVVAADGRTRILLKRWCLQVGEMPGCQFGDVMTIQADHSITENMKIM